MSEYVLKAQTLPYLFLVFHFEAKDTPSPIYLHLEKTSYTQTIPFLLMNLVKNVR